MVKKLLCGVAALILTIVEHLCFGISPMDVISTLVMAFGFTYTISMWYSDFMPDKKCTKLMWAAYGCLLACFAVLGAALIVDKMWITVVAALLAIGALICYLIEKHGLKAAAKAEKE